ncbi:MAG: TIGR00730 family Rossman fold protein [Candidatus Latescibacterota bacterium]|nr:TIGR00730 family Rossman fold protein [Candidatus Latescibacterota bacterium]
MKRICVYCGSKVGINGSYAEAATALGRSLARRSCRLVYGGGSVGLMGRIADVVLKGGGEVLGVIPRDLWQRELGHRGLTELVVVDDMHERKAFMAESAEAFVALPGAYGTLEELFEVIAWAQLEIHNKPVGLLNTNGYFDHLLSFLDHSVQEGFLREHHRDLLRVETDAEALVDDLLAHMEAGR